MMKKRILDHMHICTIFKGSFRANVGPPMYELFVGLGSDPLVDSCYEYCSVNRPETLSELYQRVTDIVLFMNWRPFVENWLLGWVANRFQDEIAILSSRKLVWKVFM